MMALQRANLVIPIHENSDTNNCLEILSPCSLLPAPLLPICINFKVKRYKHLLAAIE